MGFWNSKFRLCCHLTETAKTRYLIPLEPGTAEMLSVFNNKWLFLKHNRLIGQQIARTTMEDGCAEWQPFLNINPTRLHSLLRKISCFWATRTRSTALFRVSQRTKFVFGDWIRVVTSKLGRFGLFYSVCQFWSWQKSISPTKLFRTCSSGIGIRDFCIFALLGRKSTIS